MVYAQVDELLSGCGDGCPYGPNDADFEKEKKDSRYGFDFSSGIPGIGSGDSKSELLKFVIGEYLQG